MSTNTLVCFICLICFVLLVCLTFKENSAIVYKWLRRFFAVNKPLNVFNVAKEKEKTTIALSMYNTNAPNTVLKTQSALEKLVEAFTDHGEEAAVVEMARLYMFGLRPGINPN